MKKRAFLIAEAGVNHNGSLERAKQMVDLARDAGADAVKFQSFRTALVVSGFVEKAKYQVRQDSASGPTQRQMLEALELSFGQQQALADHAKLRGIEFLSTPFDLESLRFLVDVIGVRLLKIASGEIVNARLLAEAARTGRPLILSTGMANMQDVRNALGVIAHTWSKDERAPSLSLFQEWGSSSRLQEVLGGKVTVLHCVTDYPAAFDSLNLRAIQTIRSSFGVPVGYSDHSQGLEACRLALALGAEVLEKHFTLDKSLPGPDHAASMDPQELRDWVKMVRTSEAALGSGTKEPVAAERDNANLIRRRIVAARRIEKGEEFTEENLAVKRAMTGDCAMRYYDWVGRRAQREFSPDEGIE